MLQLWATANRRILRRERKTGRVFAVKMLTGNLFQMVGHSHAESVTAIYSTGA